MKLFLFFLITFLLAFVLSDSPPFASLDTALVDVSDAVQALDDSILKQPLNLVNALTINKEAKNVTNKLTDGVLLLAQYTGKLSDADGQTVLQVIGTMERRVNKTVTDLIAIGPQLDKLQITFIAKDDVSAISNITEKFILNLVNEVMPDSSLDEAKKLARRVNHSLFVANSYFQLLPSSSTPTSTAKALARLKQYLFF